MSDERHALARLEPEGSQAPAWVDKTALWYTKSLPLRCLARIIPYATVVDTLLAHRAQALDRQRLRMLFDELGKGEERLTEDLIQSEDFLYCFVRTTEAARRTRQERKIRAFGRLLRGGATSGTPVVSVDDFEELLATLEDMSEREVGVLCLLREYERKATTTPPGQPLIRASSFWKDFAADAQRTFQVQPEELEGFLVRLQRTGLYAGLPGTYSNHTDHVGRTTPRFERLASLAMLQDP